MQFVLPECPRCGTGILKPDVVFFGDSVPKDRVQQAFSNVRFCGELTNFRYFQFFNLILTQNDAGQLEIL